MGFAAFTFIAIFLLIASGGLIIFYREALIQRVAQVVMPRPQQTGLKDTIQQTGAALSGVMQQFERVVPKSQADVSVVQQRLIRAGYRKEAAVNYFYGAKVLVPIILSLV